MGNLDAKYAGLSAALIGASVVVALSSLSVATTWGKVVARIEVHEQTIQFHNVKLEKHDESINDLRVRIGKIE